MNPLVMDCRLRRHFAKDSEIQMGPIRPTALKEAAGVVFREGSSSVLGRRHNEKTADVSP